MTLMALVQFFALVLFARFHQLAWNEPQYDRPGGRCA
jgi:hypothetical protein